MNEQYKVILKQAIDLQFRFRDCVSDTNHPAGRDLEAHIQKVVDSIETQINPRNIESQVIEVQKQLKNLDQNDPPLIDNTKAEGLHDDYERLRINIREMDNY